MTGRSRMEALITQSDATVRGNISALLHAASDEIDGLDARPSPSLRRSAARHASDLSTYVSSGLMSEQRALDEMRSFVRREARGLRHGR